MLPWPIGACGMPPKSTLGEGNYQSPCCTAWSPLSDAKLPPSSGARARPFPSRSLSVASSDICIPISQTTRTAGQYPSAILCRVRPPSRQGATPATKEAEPIARTYSSGSPSSGAQRSGGGSTFTKSMPTASTSIAWSLLLLCSNWQP
jgi:hypothetical protein